MQDCPFCHVKIHQEYIFENETCAYIESPSKVLLGSGMIIPKIHRETVFDLTDSELEDTFKLLKRVKKMMDLNYNPDGYNVGWNCMPVGGQTVPHAHLHVIPRFSNEPMAGKGIRYHLKQTCNSR